MDKPDAKHSGGGVLGQVKLLQVSQAAMSKGGSEALRNSSAAIGVGVIPHTLCQAEVWSWRSSSPFARSDDISLHGGGAHVAKLNSSMEKHGHNCLHTLQWAVSKPGLAFKKTRYLKVHPNTRAHTMWMQGSLGN